VEAGRLPPRLLRGGARALPGPAGDEGVAAAAELLMACGFDHAARDAQGASPLHVCRSGAVAVALLRAGAAADARCRAGAAPLHWAANAGATCGPRALSCAQGPSPAARRACGCRRTCMWHEPVHTRQSVWLGLGSYPNPMQASAALPARREVVLELLWAGADPSMPCAALGLRPSQHAELQARPARAARLGRGACMGRDAALTLCTTRRILYARGRAPGMHSKLCFSPRPPRIAAAPVRGCAGVGLRRGARARRPRPAPRSRGADPKSPVQPRLTSANL